MIQSNLKTILDERGVSIRELERMTGERYESIRKLYNDEMERFPRKLLTSICNALNIGVEDLLKRK